MRCIFSGRYIRFDNVGVNKWIQFAEIESYGADGKLIKPKSAEFNEKYNGEQFTGSKSIDENLDTYCHSIVNRGQEDPVWLELDFGKQVTIAKIVIRARKDCVVCRDVTIGQRIRFSTGARGSNVVWSSRFEAGRRSTDTFGKYLSMVACMHSRDLGVFVRRY